MFVQGLYITLAPAKLSVKFVLKVINLTLVLIQTDCSYGEQCKNNESYIANTCCCGKNK